MNCFSDDFQNSDFDALTAKWSLTRMFWCLAGFVLLMALGLATPALWNVGASLARANSTMERLDKLAAGLDAAHLLSAERGATNALLLATRGELSAARGTLQTARRRTDDALDIFEDAAGQATGSADAEAVAEIGRTRDVAVAVRNEVDQFLVRPAESRSPGQTAALIARMIGLNAPIAALNLRASTDIARVDHSIAEALRVALLSAQLREYAGQLGSQVVIELIRKTETDVATIALVAHLTGRIDELRGELSATLSNIDPTSDLGRARVAIDARFFGRGLPFAKRLIQLASRPDAPLPQAFKLSYRSDLASIDALKEISLADARRSTASARSSSLRQYIAAAMVTGGVLTLLGLIGLGIKRHIVAPLAQAAEQIRNLAEDRQDGRGPGRLGCRELQDIASALVKLGQSSARRTALEHERLDLLRQLERLAHSDYLTGLANRRTLDSRLQDLFAHSTDAPRDVALLMIDIDFFKQFNDSDGHLAGDDCIRAVAHILENHAGSGLVARFGGEEFCVLLERDANDAWEIAERLRRAVQNAKLPHAARPDKLGVVTVSIGIAAAATAMTTTADLLNQADNALYVAKRRGRNESTLLGATYHGRQAVAA